MACKAAILIVAFVLGQAAAAKFQFRKTNGRTPLKLDGANCADPGSEIPKYCCSGDVPSADYVNTCECNPGWSHQECVCKGYLTKTPCHACMVHLPETNQWLKSFSKEEIHDNCKSCVKRCKDEYKEGQCSKFMADIWDHHFPGGDPSKVLCTADYLKDQLMKDDYPLGLKQALYRKPKFDADDAYHQPSDWNVAGVH
eukprot:gnl/TRDRNA2_/TRDRNA2_42251_c0_seq1.p1 gnl/TRDRNA2_/TRDRNA2_42251_c0~~gnl/TRDRNA2_/TRDRNA2_42251_c0_seq1.p1  ORF type:complete len:198 (+),score=28.72 gnl/TRDRNA2_/TRDRNA2_42251_c0_seq1:63-656(+)